MSCIIQAVLHSISLTCISQADNKSSGANINHEATRVWIDYAADIDNSSLSGLSHICRIADILRYYGMNADIDWLMGISGEAFAYYYHPDGTYLTPFVHSWDSAIAALEDYGFTGRWISSERETSVEPTLCVIEHEIIEGRLVLAPGIKASINGINSQCHYWFIVNGVDVQKQEVSLLDTCEHSANFMPLPAGDSDSTIEHPRWYGIVRTGSQHYDDNPLLLIEPTGQIPDQSDLVRQCLERMIKTGNEPILLNQWGGGLYLSGIPALERLFTDLDAAIGDGIEEFKRLNPVKGDPYGGIHEELIHLRLLSERRRAASVFLQQAALHLPETARYHMNAAADNYGEVSRLALAAFELRHGPVKENDLMNEMIRQEQEGDDIPEWAAYWKRADENLADAGIRKQLSKLIRDVILAESKAISEVEKALALPWK